MPPYRWKCYVCGETNAADTQSCSTCGFKAIASGAEIDRAREAWKATGSIHGEIPEARQNKYRTFWQRFWAGIIDGLIFVPLGLLDNAIWDHVTSVAVLVPWVVLYSVSFTAYSVVLHGVYGQTLGKRILGVKVLDVSESKLSMRQAVLRDCVPLLLTVIGLITDLPVVAGGGNPYDKAHLEAKDLVLIFGVNIWFALELITMLSNDKRRALHDFIAGSVVVRVEGRPVQIRAESAVP